MHSIPSSHIFSNQPNGQQASKHKILRNSLKLTLKSTQKIIIPSSNQPRYIPQVSYRLAQSGVGNQKQQNRNYLKRDIDVRLNKAYSTIVRHKSIQLTGKRTQNKNQSSKNPFVSVSSPEDQSTALELSSAYKQLPNELLQQYIKSIYDEYQIKDPLNGLKIDNPANNVQSLSSTQYISFEKQVIQPQTPPRNNKMIPQQSNRISTKKKILLLKNHFIDQLNTDKKAPLKIQFDNKKITTETSEFNSIQPIKSVQTKPSVISSTHNKNKPSLQAQIYENPQESSRKVHNEMLAETKLSVSSVNQLNWSLVNPRLQDSLNYSRVQNHYYNSRKPSNFKEPQIQQPIDQVFRYCFVCEEAILESNILLHQKSCTELNKILSRPNLFKEQLLTMMDQKISKVELEIRELLNLIQIKETSDKLVQLKDKVVGWIGIIDKESSLNRSDGFKKTLEQQKAIDSLIDSTKLLKTFELIKKLKWFVHLKRNFLIKIQKNPTFL